MKPLESPAITHMKCERTSYIPFTPWCKDPSAVGPRYLCLGREAPMLVTTVRQGVWLTKALAGSELPGHLQLSELWLY